MPKARKQSAGWSATTVVIALSIALVLLTWAVSASAYATARFQAEVAAAQAAGEDRPGEVMFPRRVGRVGAFVALIYLFGEFFKNALIELPRAPQVIYYVFTERLVIPLGAAVLEGLLIVGGLGLKSVERSLEQSSPAKRKKTVAGIPVPKAIDE
jgi:hypothetical protein